MSDEVRAAAERVLGCWLTSDYPREQITLSDVMAVAQAYLREHPADDETAIDEAWLKSVGLEHNTPLGAGGLSVYGWGEAEIIVQNQADYGGCKHVIALPDCDTRGQVRRLAASIGIQLKEPT